MIDAHHHLWQYDPLEYGWIDETMRVLRRDYLPQEFVDLMQQTGVAGSVAVQARQTIQETKWLLEIAGSFPEILGVVGWLPLGDPEIGSQLNLYKDQPLLKGLRHVVQDEPEDDFLLRPDFNRGIAALEGTGLTFDLLVRTSQLPATNILVRRFPHQKFVLDHLAKPDIRDGHNLDLWRSQLIQLAECPNVSCKLSGLVTEADWQRWTFEQLQPFLDTALEAFGPGRLMAGSDWPVCLVASSYRRWWETLQHWCAALDQTDQEQILGSNARRFYSLAPSSEHHETPSER